MGPKRLKFELREKNPIDNCTTNTSVWKRVKKEWPGSVEKTSLREQWRGQGPHADHMYMPESRCTSMKLVWISVPKFYSSMVTFIPINAFKFPNSISSNPSFNGEKFWLAFEELLEGTWMDSNLPFESRVSVSVVSKLTHENYVPLTTQRPLLLSFSCSASIYTNLLLLQTSRLSPTDFEP